MSEKKEPKIDSPLPPPRKEVPAGPPPPLGGGRKTEVMPERQKREIPEERVTKKPERPTTPERRPSPERPVSKAEKEPKLEREQEQELKQKIEEAVKEHAEKRGVQAPKSILEDDEFISDVAKGMVRTTGTVFGAAAGVVASMWGAASAALVAGGKAVSIGSVVKVIFDTAIIHGVPYTVGLLNPFLIIGGAVAGYAITRALTGWRKQKKEARKAAPASQGPGGTRTPSGPPEKSVSAEAPVSSEPSDDIYEKDGVRYSKLTVREAARKGVIRPGVKYFVHGFFSEMFGARTSVTEEQMKAYNSDPNIRKKVQRTGRF